MKTILIVVAILAFTSASAQEYKRFKAGLSLGYINKNSPAAGAFDAAFRINDYMAIGYRGEMADIQTNTIRSKSIYFQRYFKNFRGKFRPFASFGVGQFTPSTDMVGGCGSPHADHNVGIQKKVGLFTRIGFEVGHFTLMADANVAPKSKSTVMSSYLPTEAGYHDPYVQYLTNSYVTVKLGFFFWGGKKKSNPRLGL
ncbi:MAG TPA: hypothetical protein VL728_16745 [Cyclobacteriaceae bacterium]|jgi:hypothetical protein|nr:hypothetical protein [Cyclobacteriaceae bacterium]